MNFNPMLDYQRNQLMAQQAMIQNQLNQMNTRLPQYEQQFNPYPQNRTQFIVRQVGSIEEVKGFPVELGSIYLFLDVGTGKIYLKQLNTNNGKSELFVYSAEQTEQQPDVIEQINMRLTNIEELIKGEKNESIQNDAGDGKSNADDAATNAGKNEKTKSSNVQSSAKHGSRQE